MVTGLMQARSHDSTVSTAIARGHFLSDHQNTFFKICLLMMLWKVNYKIEFSFVKLVWIQNAIQREHKKDTTEEF